MVSESCQIVLEKCPMVMERCQRVLGSAPSIFKKLLARPEYILKTPPTPRVYFKRLLAGSLCETYGN